MEYASKYKVVTDRCIDCSKESWRGNKYVYVWLDENNKPFYVGSGCGNRATSNSRRSDKFKSKLNGNCSLYMVAENMHRLAGLSFEVYIVRFLMDLGFDLCNKAYTNQALKQYIWLEDSDTPIVKLAQQKLGEWVKGDHEAILSEVVGGNQ